MHRYTLLIISEGKPKIWAANAGKNAAGDFGMKLTVVQSVVINQIKKTFRYARKVKEEFSYRDSTENLSHTRDCHIKYKLFTL